MIFESLNTIAPHARFDKVRALAVGGPRGSSGFPNLPTVAEAGVTGFEASAWGGVVGPAGIPRPVVARINNAINRTITSIDVAYRNQNP